MDSVTNIITRASGINRTFSRCSNQNFVLELIKQGLIKLTVEIVNSFMTKITKHIALQLTKFVEKFFGRILFTRVCRKSLRQQTFYNT